MNLDPMEIVEYIEASNNVIEAQSTQIETLEKTSSEKDDKIQDLESKLVGNDKVAQEKTKAKVAEEPVLEQKVASSSAWGAGEKQETEKSDMRESEKVLYQRFGVPIN